MSLRTFLRTAAIVLLGLGALAPGVSAQGCTTQAKLTPAVRQAIADAASAFASEVKRGEVDSLKAAAIPEYAANFDSAAALVRETATVVKNDSLAVTQIYVLDARSRKSADAGDAEFSCPLQGTASETDFSISGLPPGTYAFAMVEAAGERPWLISLLLRQDAGQWKLAGLYPHSRLAAGHDGVWYWTAARDTLKQGGSKPTLSSWLLYGQADTLLRPANFVTTTNLDKLRSEQRAATPPELVEGISAETPLVLTGAGGSSFRFSAIRSEGSADGKRLNLVVHVLGETATAAAASAQTAFNAAAASALLTAHKELRQGFDAVTVIADVAGRAPFATVEKMSEIQ